jgi:two-component sensor histidine kinase
VVVVVDTRSGVLERPVPAATLLVVLAVWSAVWTVAVGRRDRWVAGPGAAVDVALAALTVAVDEFVYASDRPQSLASAWPLTAVLATGVATGPGWGLVAGTTVGVANVAAAAVDGAIGGRVLAQSGATVLYAAAGWVAGWVAAQLRHTAEVAAAAEARAEVARTLHDGVLQTLAVVQRRSTDADLVALAREQDAELRAFLRGDDMPVTPRAASAGVDVVSLLGPALARVEARHEVSAHLVVVEAGTAEGAAAEALAAATAEAVTNAARHAGVSDVWVSVDRRHPAGTQVVVHDEGRGFDPSVTREGDGMTRSVRERLAAVGGAAEVRSSPGAGCEVTLWVP